MDAGTVSNRRGRILRVKRGTNPNSSSVGSDIPAFLFSAVAMTVLGALVVQVHDLIRGAFGRGEGTPPPTKSSDAP